MPLHIEVIPLEFVITAIGEACTVTVKVCVELLTHEFAFFTVIVPVYVPGEVPRGMLIVIVPPVEVPAKDWSVTVAKLLAGEAFHVML